MPVCLEKECKREAVIHGFCRLHYIKYWKCLKMGIDPFDVEKREMLLAKGGKGDWQQNGKGGNGEDWSGLSDIEIDIDDDELAIISSQLENNDKDFKILN